MLGNFLFPPTLGPLQLGVGRKFNPLREVDYQKRNLGIRKAELKPKAYRADKET